MVSKESRRVVQFDPRGDSRSSRHRHHSRDGRSDRDRSDHRHHRSHSHPSRQSHDADRGHSRDPSDRKRRRDDYHDQSPSEGTPMLSISVLSFKKTTGLPRDYFQIASYSAVVDHHKPAVTFGGFVSYQEFKSHLVPQPLVLKSLHAEQESLVDWKAVVLNFTLYPCECLCYMTGSVHGDI